jgi:hypothetical protein
VGRDALSLGLVTDDTPGLNRIARILAFMIASSAGLSILSIVAVLIAGTARVDMTGGVWPVIAVLPFVGLTLAALLIVALLVVSILRRRAAGAGQ